MKKYKNKIIEPAKIFFKSYYDLSEDIQNRIEQTVREQRYFDLNYTVSIGSIHPVFGPETLAAKGGVADLKKSTIAFTGEMANFLFLSPPEEFENSNSAELSRPRETDFAEVVELIQSSDFKLETPESIHEVDYSIDENNEVIIFNINSVEISLQYSDGVLFIIYPSDVSLIDTIANELFDFIKGNFNNTLVGDSPFTIEANQETLSEVWIFDTNAIYHQIIGDEATSILKSILPNLQIYGSKILLCWPVLYEINKHKDESGPPPSVQEVGVDNLNTLKILDEYGFIDLSVDSIPENIRTKVSESHVADLHVLQRTQTSEAVLISGDLRLGEIARISSTPVIDIQDLADVKDVPDLRTEIWDEVHTHIGSEIHERQEILERIESQQSEVSENVKAIEEGPRPDPESYLNQWVEDGDLIPYPHKTDDDEGDEIRFEKSVDQDAVITPAVASHLSNEIVSVGDQKYLSEDVLSYFAQLLNLPGPGLPLITFHVPVSNVLGPQSVSMGGISAEARQFYQLSQLENADYVVEEVQGSGMEGAKVRDSIQLAREHQYTILCADTDRFITPIGGLLGIDVKEFEY